MDGNMTDLISCPICSEEYDGNAQRSARLLPCGHTLCASCLTCIISGNGSTGRVCAECRSDLPPALRSAADFPRNFAIEAIADEARRLNNAAHKEKPNSVRCPHKTWRVEPMTGGTGAPCTEGTLGETLELGQPEKTLGRLTHFIPDPQVSRKHARLRVVPGSGSDNYHLWVANVCLTAPMTVCRCGEWHAPGLPHAWRTLPPPTREQLDSNTVPGVALTPRNRFRLLPDRHEFIVTAGP